MVAVINVRGKRCPYCGYSNKNKPGTIICENSSCCKRFTVDPVFVKAIRCECHHDTIVQDNFQDSNEVIHCGNDNCRRQLWPELELPLPETAPEPPSRGIELRFLSEDIPADLKTIVVNTTFWIGRLHPSSVGQRNWDELSLKVCKHIKDEYVSRVHAQIYIEDGGSFVIDFGSTNGIRITGPNVEPKGKCLTRDAPYRLRVGDVINLDKKKRDRIFQIEVSKVAGESTRDMG